MAIGIIWNLDAEVADWESRQVCVVRVVSACAQSRCCVGQQAAVEAPTHSCVRPSTQNKKLLRTVDTQETPTS